MKKILYSLAFAYILLCGCKKETSNGPVISGVRSYLAAPGDSVLNSLVPGQWVVLLGHNLKGATQITFNGIPASYNSALFSDTSAAVQVPDVIPFPSVPADLLNTIRYVTPEGSTTFTFDIVAPAPSIIAVSNENANSGDTVRVYGLNFFFIKSIHFAGTPVTTFAGAADGTSVGFTLPTLTQSGPVVITTQSGSASTVFNVNDVTTGALCNFDDVNTYSWGATNTTNSSSLFPGNRGNYAIMDNKALNANEWSWWNGGRGINTNGAQWVPVDSLNRPVDNYAFKFEINIPNAWNGGSIFVAKDYSFNYIGLFEPWKNPDGTTSDIMTRGWRTVTIPLSSFRKDNGTGTQVSTLKDLLGNSGAGGVNIWLINNSSSPMATGFYAAVDNIRVIKVK
jgi:hypothetical protein